MVSAEIGSSGTIRALRALIIAAFIIQTLIFCDDCMARPAGHFGG
jgi:hypothetical protein